jgi:CBS domain-containing protein
MDFAKLCMELEDVYVGQIMQPNPPVLNPNDRVIHARRLLLDEEMVGLPVMDGGKLVGIVTIRDIAMRLAAFQAIVPDEYKNERIRNLLVGDVMSQLPTTTRTDEKLSEASRVMLENHFSSLPTLNLQGELVGLLTKNELTVIVREKF